MSRVSFDTLPGGAVRVTNSATGVWDSAGAWRIVEELRIGRVDGSGADVFAEISGLEVDAYGRIWVLDGQQHELRVFDREGRHVRTVGRRGSGPGEFKRPIGMARSPDDYIWVVDPQNGRYVAFDTAGSFIGSHPRRLGFYQVPWLGRIDSRGRLYEVAVELRPDGGRKESILRLSSDLARIDTFPLPDFQRDAYEVPGPGGRIMAGAPVPFSPDLQWHLDVDGHLWFGITGEYRIYERRLSGDTLRVIERAWEALPVGADERDRVLSYLEEFANRYRITLDLSRIPATKPAFITLAVDRDGSLWVFPIRREGAGPGVDVFDAEGRYLGAARVEGAVFPLPLLRFGPDEKLYSVGFDELGVPFVVRSRIERGRTDDRVMTRADS